MYVHVLIKSPYTIILSYVPKLSDQGQISIDSDKLKNTRNPSSQFQTVTWSGSNICRQGAIFLRENLNITLIAQHVKIKLCVVYDIVLVFKSIFD